MITKELMTKQNMPKIIFGLVFFAMSAQASVCGVRNK
jgi:hypothetical protein